MARSVFAAGLCGVLICAASNAADDPIRKKLDASKAAYEKAIKDYTEEVGKWFEKEDANARKLKEGVTEKVKQVSAEKKEFEDKGVLPKRAATALRDKPAKAMEVLTKAYKTAADDYSRERKDDKAAAALEEFEEFKKGSSATASPPGVPLFDGKTLDGWRQTEITSWQVVKGEMVGTGRFPVGILIRDDTKCSNFTLRCKLIPPDDGDACITFWTDENKQNGVYPCYQVVVGRQAFGQVRRLIGQGNAPIEVAHKPNKLKKGEPAVVEIRVKDRQLIVTADGNTVTDHPKLLGPLSGGFIGMRPTRDSTLVVKELTIIKQDQPK